MTGTISILRMANTLLFCVAEEAKPANIVRAAAESCPQWARERQYQVNLIDQEIAVTADARIAKYYILLIQRYSIKPGDGEGDPGVWRIRCSSKRKENLV
ncbi:hypothetical protein MFRU_026g00590 [Monilinia fructicola]|nr:hypothetical protein MFRU_026g00590 [Monilinia fructicola]